MATDQTLQILIDVRSRLDDVVKAQAEFRKMREEVTSTGQALKTGFGIELARRGLDILTSSLKAAVSESFRFAGQVKDAAEALGLSTTVYQTLRLQMRDAGLDEARLTMAISSQTQSLAAARDATSAAAKAYRDLGLSAAQVELLPIEERLITVARAFANAKDKTAAYDAAASILGARALPQLLNALKNLGVEGVAALTALYQAQGLIADQDTIERLDRAQKAWGKVWHAIVIGSGNAIAMLDKFRESAGKDFWGTVGDLLKVGPMGLGLGDLTGRLALDNPAKPAAPGPDPQAIIEAQARAAANMAAAEQAKVLAKSNAEAAERDAKKLIAAQEWAATLTREHTEDLKRQGEEIRQSVLTPNEEYAEKVRHLSNLHAQGAIDAATFQRAVAAASDEMDKKTKPPKKYQRPQTAGEGVEAFAQNMATTGELVAGTLQGTLGATVQ
ncbi:MAG: hypothetical protein Q8J74_00810, partial [Candidatus Didemnitutus sp.]|nr:hypothetical protein [Candidatus Didemnitutus sp.]